MSLNVNTVLSNSLAISADHKTAKHFYIKITNYPSFSVPTTYYSCDGISFEMQFLDTFSAVEAVGYGGVR